MIGWEFPVERNGKHEVSHKQVFVTFVFDEGVECGQDTDNIPCVAGFGHRIGLVVEAHGDNMFEAAINLFKKAQEITQYPKEGE